MSYEICCFSRLKGSGTSHLFLTLSLRSGAGKLEVILFCMGNCCLAQSPQLENVYFRERNMCNADLFYVIKRFLMNEGLSFLNNFAGINVSQLQICFSVVVVHKTLLCLCSVILSVKVPS